MSRKNAREILYKLVFEFTFSREINETTETMLLSDATLSDDDRAYVERIYLGISERFEELTELILKYTVGYSSAERLVKADFVAMLISAYELSFEKDIPAGVSISEAVDLVKQYGTTKSSGFVNGVLASINREVREDG